MLSSADYLAVCDNFFSSHTKSNPLTYNGINNNFTISNLFHSSFQWIELIDTFKTPNKKKY